MSHLDDYWFGQRYDDAMHAQTAGRRYICTECEYTAPQPWQLCPQCKDPGAVCATPAEIARAEAELKGRGFL